MFRRPTLDLTNPFDIHVCLSVETNPFDIHVCLSVETNPFDIHVCLSVDIRCPRPASLLPFGSGQHLIS